MFKIQFSLNNSVVALRNVIRKIFSTNNNDEYYHVVNCYLEDRITIFYIFEVKNKLLFYKVKWFKLISCGVVFFMIF